MPTLLDDLSLHEQLLLLALHDDRGTLQTGNFEVAAGGAVLGELLLEGRVALEPVKSRWGKRSLVNVVNASALGDPILDDALERMRTSKRREAPDAWVRRVAGTKRLRHRIADRLRQRGIISKQEGRVLLVFSRDLYPTVNPAPERELVARMRQAVLEDGDVGPRTALMVALAIAVGLLKPVLTREEHKARKQRLKQLGKGELMSADAHAAIASVQAVIAAQHAVMIAAAG